VDRDMVLTVGPLLFVLVFLWQGRGEIFSGWRQRRILPASLYWSIAALYALAGAAVTFSMWASILGLDSGAILPQTVTILGLVLFGPIRILAGVLAKPQLVAHDVPARDRNAFHGLLMLFWMAGFALGLILLFLRDLQR